MCREHVELCAHKRLGICLKLRHERAAKAVRIGFAREIVHKCAAERVIHNAVQLEAVDIFSPSRKAMLVARLFPDLAEKERLGIQSLDLTPQKCYEFVGQLVCNVEPPARYAEARPFFEHAFYKIHIRRLVFIYLGQRFEAPPRAVLVREALKIIPFRVLRFARLVSAVACISSETIKIYAVVARVRKYSVEDYTYAALGGLPNKSAKIVLCAQDWVYAHIVGRVVAMVRGRFKYRIEIYEAHAHIVKIIELFADSVQTAAEKVVWLIIAPAACRQIARFVTPILMQRHGAPERAVIFHSAHVYALASACESVGEYLIYNALGKAFGRFESPVIYGYLERGRFAAA